MTLVLVTGGAGFIGSHTVDLLLARGYDVRILDSLQPRVHPRIRTKHQGRAERGVVLDDAFWLWYVAQLHLRAGRRVRGARARACLAWNRREPRRLALAQ